MQIAHPTVGDVDPDALVAASRERAPTRLAGRDRFVTTLLALGFLGVALPLALMAGGPPPAAQTALLVLGYAALSRIEFEVGSGAGAPTGLVFVPMLFALPAGSVPLCVAAGLLLGSLLDGRLHLERALVRLGNAWFAIGPAAVLVAAGSPEPRLGDWPLYLLAFGAQVALDVGGTTFRECVGVGVSPRLLFPALGWVALVDALVAPVGLGVALADAVQPVALGLILPLAGLLWLLAREGRARVDRALVLADAYRLANDEARRDALTGLGNRLAWEEALAAADGLEGSTSVIVIDLDGLKAANDLHGHDLGDRLLCAAAAALRVTVREHDLVARIGGDEFGIILRGMSPRGCAEAAVRVRRALTRHPGLDGVRLCASIGFASSPPASTAAEAVRSADADMYARKRRAGAERGGGRLVLENARVV